MRSISKLLCTILSVTALLSLVILPSGCDDDKMWSKVSNPNGDLLLAAMVSSLQFADYNVSLSIEGNVTTTWSGLRITIGGQTFILDSSSPTNFSIRSLASLVSNVSASYPFEWTCDPFPIISLDSNSLSITLLNCDLN